MLAACPSCRQQYNVPDGAGVVGCPKCHVMLEPAAPTKSAPPQRTGEQAASPGNGLARAFWIALIPWVALCAVFCMVSAFDYSGHTVRATNQVLAGFAGMLGGYFVVQAIDRLCR